MAIGLLTDDVDMLTRAFQPLALTESRNVALEAKCFELLAVCAAHSYDGYQLMIHTLQSPSVAQLFHRNERVNTAVSLSTSDPYRCALNDWRQMHRFYPLVHTFASVADLNFKHSLLLLLVNVVCCVDDVIERVKLRLELRYAGLDAAMHELKDCRLLELVELIELFKEEVCFTIFKMIYV